MRRFLPLAMVLCCAPAWAQKSLSVRVVDAAGTPIQSAHVLIETTSDSDAPPLLPKVTGASGTAQFSLPSPRDGQPPNIRIIAGAKGYTFNAILLLRGEGIPEVRLARGRTWRGKIVDEAGKPLAGVKVAITGALRDRDYGRLITLRDKGNPLLPLYSTITGADGTFAIENAPDDRNLFFRATSAGFALAQGTEARAGFDEQITLKRGGRLHGRAIGPDGKPLANIRVRATAPLDASLDGAGNEATTNAQGAFTIDNLAPGSYQLGTELRPDAPYILLDRPNVRVFAGKTTELAPWRAQRGVLIRGTVRDAATKKPLAHTGVFARNRAGALQFAWSNSDASGKFAVRVLPGTYTVEPGDAPSGYLDSSAERQVKVDASGKQSVSDLSFSLRRAPLIRGVLLDEGGQPIAARLGASLGGTIRSDSRGRWHLTPFRAGNLIFSPSSDDNGYFEVVGPKVVEWPIKGQVFVTVRRNFWTGVGGRVVTPEGTPIEGVLVQCENWVGPQGGPWTVAKKTDVTDKYGRYDFPQLQGIKGLKVFAKKPGFEFQSGGAVRTMAKSLVTGVTMSDLVLTSLNSQIEGITQPNAQVLVEGRETRADASGHFTVANLPAGPHTAFAAKDDLFGSTTGATNLEIALQPLMLQPQDIALAQELWAQLKQAGKAPLTLQEWLSPPPFAERVKAAQAVGDTWRIAESLETWKKGDSLDALQNGLDSIKPPDQRADSFLKAALATNDAALMERALNETETIFKGSTTAISLRESQMYRAAVLRERTGGAEDGQLALSTAFAYTLQNHAEKTRGWGGTLEQIGRNQALAEVAPIVAQGSPALLHEVLDSIDDGTGYDIHALSLAIPVVVKTHGLAAALPLFKQLQNKPVPKLDGENNYVTFNPQWAYAQAVIDTIPLIGAKSPAKALELAQSVESGDQGTDQLARALASAAEFQPPAVATRLYREAVQKIGTDSAPRIAALVWNRDPKLGLELFSIARQKADAEMKSRLHYRNAWIPFAFYFALANPAESRLILEREWAQSQRNKTDIDDRALIATAMTRIDAKRALEMVSQLPQNSGWDSDARLRIARFLFADAITRQTLALHPLGRQPAWNTRSLQW